MKKLYKIVKAIPKIPRPPVAPRIISSHEDNEEEFPIVKISKAPYLSPLYMKPAKGTMRTWRVWAEGDRVFTEYGEVGGKMQRTVGSRCKTTNEDRSNERGPEAQARFEAEALWKKQVERKYRQTPEATEECTYLPMLAQNYWKEVKGKPREVTSVGKKLPTRVFMQRKLNGVRCIARWVNGKVVLSSRAGKPWHIDHIRDEMRCLLPQEVAFDGELYIHRVPLQTITSLARDYREESHELRYYVYDCVHLEKPLTPQYDRLLMLANLLEEIPEGWKTKLVDSVHTSIPKLAEFEREYVKKGYEGIMIRDPAAPYRWGVRSPGLLKYKSFFDAEFTVLDVEEGKGKFEKCAVFVCKNDKNDETFSVSPKVDTPTKKLMWKNRKMYIGKKYTVRFYDRYEDTLLPQFPVGIAFRDAKDL